ncbi:hypothetical protein [Pseudomonas aeruginosa]|uniref:hypothetical protein n=1 Tax=Pseudomonas aeruginosa TaxID=287 RepID=UPI00093C04A1|nr:hypothetical protein [Pseudomonas aeruginosa]MBG4610133.1 hypothetical protein [Pseudomonas aeruginosa]MBG5537656.1 hypothetical protein [Pseudomonas aeruginosa]MBG5781845.1 hypothetical protein [Pseudomonas aeruginosa]MBT9112148.1 hypothetical protein [Pseudomonas aeruginosa]MBT9117889.1 hypothetical protein [Pseudomonas aeruginosa]
MNKELNEILSTAAADYRARGDEAAALRIDNILSTIPASRRASSAPAGAVVLATTNQHEWENALASYSARFDRTVSVCGASEHQDQYVFGWVDRAKKGEGPVTAACSTNAAELLRLVELLGAVAGAAARAADESWDQFDEGGKPCQAVKPRDYRQLTDALEECDGEPDLDDGKDRAGWLVVLDRLRALLTPETAKPAPARRAL